MKTCITLFRGINVNVERYIGVPATGRNWRTVQKVLTMARERN